MNEWLGHLNANFVVFCMGVLSFAANLVLFFIAEHRRRNDETNKQILKQLRSLERFKNRTAGWVLANFGVELNGD